MAIQIIKTLNIPAPPAPATIGNGLLYNAFAYQHANFAPANWKVPTREELITLISVVKTPNAISANRQYPAFANGWRTPGSDNYGFGLLPAGLRVTGSFVHLTIAGTVASTTYKYTDTVYGLFCDPNSLLVSYNSQITGLSCRLLMVDSSGWTEGDTLTDVDGNVYDTVKIGNQVWTKSNWKCTKLNDSTPIPEVTLASAWQALSTPGMCSYNNEAIIEE